MGRAGLAEGIVTQGRASHGWWNPFNICPLTAPAYWALQDLSGWFLESRPPLVTPLKQTSFASETPSSPSLGSVR